MLYSNYNAPTRDAVPSSIPFPFENCVNPQDTHKLHQTQTQHKIMFSLSIFRCRFVFFRCFVKPFTFIK